MSDQTHIAPKDALRCLSRLPMALASRNLTPTQFILMAGLYEAPAGMQELAETIFGYKTRPVTELVNQLLSKGMVTKVKSLKDTRVSVVSLTDSGVATVDSVVKEITQVMEDEKLCDGCGESVDDPGMDLCSHCAEDKEADA